MIHEVNVLERDYLAIRDGSKSFLLDHASRKVKVGDELILSIFPKKKQATMPLCFAVGFVEELVFDQSRRCSASCQAESMNGKYRILGLLAIGRPGQSNG